ncbi:hypothetical protein [Mastigocladopsis repens]|uniref:hypothetical protein n=1 Tax=Mastigocladopsis repens TaxID=221287 RepID=UPI002FBE421A
MIGPRSVPVVSDLAVEKMFLVLLTQKIHSSDHIPLVEKAAPMKQQPEQRDDTPMASW